MSQILVANELNAELFYFRPHPRTDERGELTHESIERRMRVKPEAGAFQGWP